MSRLIHATPAVIVYDDVLPSDEFSRLFSHLNGLEYSSVHARTWRKVWRLHDGNPLTGQAAWYYATNPDAAPAGDRTFPTRSPLDALISWMRDHLPEVESVIGAAGSDWEKLSFAPWIYPAGSGLSLHQDGILYSGAFTYFAHPEWRLHWGGHLLVLDPRTQSLAGAYEELWPPFLADTEESMRAFDPGLALTVLPKPNRIVFLSATALHLMTRVDSNAGQASRVSVAGFFHKP